MLSLRFMPVAGLVRLSLVGATAATMFDAVHVHTQTLSYPRPFLFGQAAFVFPGFILAFASMAYAYAALVRWLPPSIPRELSTSPARGSELVEALTTFSLAYALSGYGNRDPMRLALVLYATAALRLALSPDRLFMIIVAVVLAIAGMAAEGTMSRFGLVAYRAPEIYGVPFWLGALYMHGAFALRAAMRLFIYGAGAR
jgi:hypothetical protein